MHCPITIYFKSLFHVLFMNNIQHYILSSKDSDNNIISLAHNYIRSFSLLILTSRLSNFISIAKSVINIKNNAWDNASQQL